MAGAVRLPRFSLTPLDRLGKHVRSRHAPAACMLPRGVAVRHRGSLDAVEVE